MKLAIVSPFYPEISGVGQYGLRLAEGLARTGRFADIRIFGNARPGAATMEQGAGFTIERVWQRNDLGAAPAIRRALYRWRPDLIWFNVGLSIFGSSRIANFFGLATPLIMKSGGWPTVVTLHEVFEATNLNAIGAVNGRLTQWGATIASRMILRADRVCLTLKPYLQLIGQRYGARNLILMPLGAFDPPHFTPLPAEKKILGFALLAPYKGLQSLIETYRELQAADPALKLTIAGSDHPRFPGYFAAAKAANSDVPGVEWLPDVPEAQLPALFESAWAVALPYAATTGASSVSHRAAAHGRPIVAYNLPDLRAVSTEENLRIEFVAAGDQAAFRERLRRLLNDPAECERIGRANVTAMQSHTLEVTCRRYIEVFEAALQQRAALGWPVTNE